MSTLSLCIDRFEGDFAVLLDQEGIKRFDYPRSNLPAGLSEGDWILVEINGDQIIFLRLDPEAKQSIKNSIDQKLDRLRKRSNKS